MKLQLRIIYLILCFVASLLTTAPLFAQPENQWVRYYENESDQGSSSEKFWDIYQKADDGFIAVGFTNSQEGRSQGAYVCNVDRNGEKLWDRQYSFDQFPTQDVAYSVVETDDGGFAVGGRSGEAGGLDDHFSVIRLDQDGEIVWAGRYNERGDYFGNCYAVIETKGGGILAVGDAPQGRNAYPGLQYAVMLSNEGDVVWEYYSDQDDAGKFNAVREIADDGYVMAGSSGNDTEIIKLNQQGELVWERNYRYSFNSMTSCREGGFALSAVTGGGWGIQRVNNDGNHVFFALREIDQEQAYWNCGCIAQLSDNGFAFVGPVGSFGRNTPSILRTDRAGNEMWFRQDHYGSPHIGSEEYRSVIIARDNSIVVAGRSYNETRPDSSFDAIIVKLVPDVSAPVIMEAHPELRDLLILTNDSVAFSVRAIDLQEDSICYLWRLDEEIVSEESSVVIPFNETGEFTVSCLVADEEPGDSVSWRIVVAALYISAFTPDTLDLALRRGTSVDFSLDSIRYTEGADPEILWTKTNLANGQVENSGEDAQATFAFPWSVDYTVEGRVTHGESSDAVTWNVAVKGAIWAFIPLEDSLAVLPDSQVHFEIVPTDPENDSSTIQWFVDAELVRENEPTLIWRFGTGIRNPPYITEITVVVTDSIESDTVTWTVNVRPLGIFDDGKAGQAGTPVLLGVMPNPFNSTVTIRYAVGLETDATRLTIHDISGREVYSAVIAPSVTEIRNTPPTPPAIAGGDRAGTSAIAGGDSQTLVWDASTFPAGIYFARLARGSDVQTVKMVLVR